MSSVCQNIIIQFILFVKNFYNIAKGAEENGVKAVKAFDTTDSAKEYVGKIIKDGDVLLVKASRGMKFENIISEIAKETK